ncbi:MAG: lipoate--protein ligase family protein, partial [Candidatus Omnitrophota bacterium]
MKFVDLSLVSGEENIAADERLLASADRSPDNEILRLWQPDRHSVVLGISGRAQQEVRSDYCRANGIPVLRRSSGGAAVVIGPGCLNYSLILNTQSSGPLSNIRSTNAWIMQIHRDLCRRLSGKHIEICGHTDLAVDGRKFSGNSQRR